MMLLLRRFEGEIKMDKNYDFSGWATRNDLKCADGRTIRANAFADQDGKVVPLVWNHNHGSLDEVIGHALLENRPEGVYTYGYFNDTEKGRNAKLMVQHGDLTSLSICANKLKQNGGNVLHGIIREVSLVLAGANPGAYIDTVMAHADGTDEEAIIYTGDYLVHSDEVEENEEETEDVEETTVSENSEDTVEHAAGDDGMKAELAAKQPKEGDQKMPEKEKTVQDVIDSMTEEQKNVMYALVGMAAEDKGSKDEGDDEEMDHNLFSNGGDDEMLMHAEIDAAVADAKKFGSMKEAFLEHGITDVEYLFPDAKNVTDKPTWIKRDTDWVQQIMSAVHHTPFSRIKSMHADLTEDEARARGYIKGHIKKEEVFKLLKRTTTPTTVYKKQKMDRDDVIDITDFDVVAWLKSEMRMMLDEELARAFVFGDGRDGSSDEHINELNIRPIISDEKLYTKHYTVAAGADTDETTKNVIKAIIKNRKDYKGSAKPVAIMGADFLSDCLLLEDGFSHALYEDEEKLAKKLRVTKIIEVPDEITPEGFYCMIVNLGDYNVGADKGGAVNMFDDFDIDYNAQKYLIETRCSGALVTPFAAQVFKAADSIPQAEDSEFIAD